MEVAELTRMASPHPPRGLAFWSIALEAPLSGQTPRPGIWPSGAVTSVRPRCGNEGRPRPTAVPLWRALLGVTALLLASGCGSGSPPIVYATEVDGNKEIYSVDVRGERVRNLTKTPGDEWSPQVSPNGKLVAFVSASQEGTTVEVMKTNGEDRRRLSGVAADHGSVRWSPDSRRVAYVESQGGKAHGYVARLDGTTPILLSSFQTQEVGSWSPNGQAVAFVARGKGIWARNPDGVNEIQLTGTPDTSPVWSPDGRKIAFLSTRDGNPEIYVMKADGTDQQRLTESPAAERDIAWSPDGRRLLFVSERDGNREVYTLELPKGKLARLTYNSEADEQPVWSRNGEKIAFISMLDGDAEIFVMDADGGNQNKLTNNSVTDASPSW